TTQTQRAAHHDTLGGALTRYPHQNLIPELHRSLSKKEWDITPYVNVFNQVPEKGFTQFNDHPRYSTGYTTLWNTLGMMIETHMLKPYDQRVYGTYELLRSMIALTDKDSEHIRKLRASTAKAQRERKVYRFNYVPDSTKYTKIQFQGFEA